ncbi:putative zinc finger protein [Crenobacter luteus]|uniref:Putative zinc-finger domain-containing protein n=1 Tax=Crenobacter luteus TaxID=1452487 RepID=A0A165G610_9NEIS|nr:zf-HC2 domain-containing protein [Crenobacter luteus]KZE35212.1 hypothetical protein AVW16_04080 [Crenobacter luteus]TCP10691.1 putative zinc finger protein [Crenobacter luteus]
MIIHCRAASRLISAALDRPLTVREACQLRFHLLLCRDCRAFSRQLGLIRRAARRAGNGES